MVKKDMLCLEHYNDDSYSYYLFNDNGDKTNIVRCNNTKKGKMYEVNFDSYEEVVIHPIANRIISTYGKESYKELKEYFSKNIEEYKCSIALNKNEVVNLFVYLYLYNKRDCIDDKGYEYNMNTIMDKIYDTFYNIFDKVSSLGLDYRSEIINDMQYRNTVMEFKTIISYLRNEYRNEKDIDSINDLKVVLNRVDEKLESLIEDVQKNVEDRLRQSNVYKLNKKIAFKAFKRVIDDNLLSLIDYEKSTTRLDLLVTYIPNEIIYEIVGDIISNSKNTELVSIYYYLATNMCRKEDGSIYSQKTMDLAIINYYNFLKSRNLIKVYEKRIEHDMDDRKSEYGYEPYYSSDEVDYYGDETFFPTDISNSRKKGGF